MRHSNKWKIIAALALALTMVFPFVSCAQKQDDTVVSYEQEQDVLPPVEVSMPEYKLAYAGELEDVIVVKETQTGALSFFVKLSGGETPIFTLHFNSTEGEFVTMLPGGEDEKVPVAFAMEQIPEDLSEEDEALFYLAQESVNEIAESLKLK